MGGVMFILGVGITIFILGWGYMLEGQFTHLYIYLFALVFGMIGFVDDYRKVRQHQNEGLTAKQKFILQLAAAVLLPRLAATPRRMAAIRLAPLPAALLTLS